MRRQRILTLVSASSLLVIGTIVIGTWGIFPKAMSQTPGNAAQDKVSADELSVAIDAQKRAAVQLTRSSSFGQSFQKLSDKMQRYGTVPVIVKVRAVYRPEG